MDQLFQLKQLRINGGSRITAPRAASASICSSSRRGIIFAITEFGLAVTKSDDLYHKLRSVEAGSEKWVDLRIGIDFTKIKLSCCQEFLLASHSTSLYIYRKIFTAEFNIEFTSKICDFRPNPLFSPACIAVLLDNGHLAYANLDGTFTGTRVMNGTCISWSQKGKQLACGQQNGEIHQVSLEGEIKRIIPLQHDVELLLGRARAQDLVWLEDKLFLVIYASIDTDETTICVLSRDPDSKDVLLKDPACTFGAPERKLSYYIEQLVSDHPLGKYLFLIGNYASSDIGVLSCSYSNEWYNLNIPEESMPTLPLDDQDETWPIGMVIDFTDSGLLPGCNIDIPATIASPNLVIMINTGLIVAFTCHLKEAIETDSFYSQMVKELAVPVRLDLNKGSTVFTPASTKPVVAPTSTSLVPNPKVALGVTPFCSELSMKSSIVSTTAERSSTFSQPNTTQRLGLVALPAQICKDAVPDKADLKTHHKITADPKLFIKAEFPNVEKVAIRKFNEFYSSFEEDMGTFQKFKSSFAEQIQIRERNILAQNAKLKLCFARSNSKLQSLSVSHESLTFEGEQSGDTLALVHSELQEIALRITDLRSRDYSELKVDSLSPEAERRCLSLNAANNDVQDALIFLEEVVELSRTGSDSKKNQAPVWLVLCNTVNSVRNAIKVISAKIDLLEDQNHVKGYTDQHEFTKRSGPFGISGESIYGDDEAFTEHAIVKTDLVYTELYEKLLKSRQDTRSRIVSEKSYVNSKANHRTIRSLLTEIPKSKFEAELSPFIVMETAAEKPLEKLVVVNTWTIENNNLTSMDVSRPFAEVKADPSSKCKTDIQAADVQIQKLETIRILEFEKVNMGPVDVQESSKEANTGRTTLLDYNSSNQARKIPQQDPVYVLKFDEKKATIADVSESLRVVDIDSSSLLEVEHNLQSAGVDLLRCGESSPSSVIISSEVSFSSSLFISPTKLKPPILSPYVLDSQQDRDQSVLFNKITKPIEAFFSDSDEVEDDGELEDFLEDEENFDQQSISDAIRVPESVLKFGTSLTSDEISSAFGTIKITGKSIKPESSFSFANASNISKASVFSFNSLSFDSAAVKVTGEAERITDDCQSSHDKSWIPNQAKQSNVFGDPGIHKVDNDKIATKNLGLLNPDFASQCEITIPSVRQITLADDKPLEKFDASRSTINSMFGLTSVGSTTPERPSPEKYLPDHTFTTNQSVTPEEVPAAVQNLISDQSHAPRFGDVAFGKMSTTQGAFFSVPDKNDVLFGSSSTHSGSLGFANVQQSGESFGTFKVTSSSFGKSSVFGDKGAFNTGAFGGSSLQSSSIFGSNVNLNTDSVPQGSSFGSLQTEPNNSVFGFGAAKTYGPLNTTPANHSESISPFGLNNGQSVFGNSTQSNSRFGFGNQTNAFASLNANNSESGSSTQNISASTKPSSFSAASFKSFR